MLRVRRETGYIVVTLALFASAGGCGDRETPPPAAPVAEHPARKNDAEHPRVKESRADTEAFLNDLLAGKYDADASFAPVARRVKGYTKWDIDSQEADPDNPGAVHIGGTLSGPAGQSRFRASMHRQQNGRWMLGWFDTPLKSDDNR